MAPHGPPRSLRLVTGTYPVMRGVRYTVSRGIVTRVQQGTPARTCRRKPDPEEWDRFWKTVERLGVRVWRRNYDKPREAGTYTLDGKGWRFSMRGGSFVVHSGGRGGFPSMGNPRESTCSTTALETLQTALDRLIDGPPMPTETLGIDGIFETGAVPSVLGTHDDTSSINQAMRPQTLEPQSSWVTGKTQMRRMVFEFEMPMMRPVPEPPDGAETSNMFRGV